jgi:hypothetical protein
MCQNGKISRRIPAKPGHSGSETRGKKDTWFLFAGTGIKPCGFSTVL